jgi:hypothetical protein
MRLARDPEARPFPLQLGLRFGSLLAHFGTGL